MADDLFLQLAGMVFAGGGLLSAAGMNLLLQRTAWRVRVAVTVLVCGAALAGVWAVTDEVRAVGRAGAVLAAGLGLCLVAGSGRAAAAGAAILAGLRRAGLRWGLVAAAGLGTVCWSVVRYQIDVDTVADRQLTELELLTAIPPLSVLDETPAATDRGTPVWVRQATAPRNETALRALEGLFLGSPAVRDQVIRRRPADDRANCHGWVFTGGRYWLTGSVVEQVLDENGYRPVAEPRPGDLVVYRSGPTVCHTGVVWYAGDRSSLLVESKWGCTGVFLHPVDKSIYGTEFTYYRSPRRGHLLAGLGGPLASAAGAAQFAEARPAADDLAE